MKLKHGDHIHLMGICGTAMASLAGLLKDKGFRVTGSDVGFYPPMSTQLEALKIPIMTGYKPENLEPRPDLVIVGNVISRDNPEAARLMANVEGADVMTMHCDATRDDDGLKQAVAESLREVMRLRGEVAFVPAGSLPQDGKVIEDARRYE